MKLIKTAKWIRPKNDYVDACPVFFRSFCCEKPIAKAVLQITAMGVYETTLNGQRVGDFIMAPGWTAYDARHQYQSYDITESLQKENRLSVSVGSGWYRSELVAWRDKNIWGGLAGLIAAIEIEYTDGTTETIVTDKQWKAAEGAVKFSNIYDGEIYDARCVPEEQDEVVYLHAPKTNLIPQEGEIVREQETLLPIAMFQTPKGETVIDFGQNMTGYVSFTVNARAGERLVYSHAEILDADGNFYTANLRSAKQRIEYTCKDGVQTYKPHHTFMGFRYIRLDEAPENISIDAFKAIVVHSDMKRTGFFACSNEKVNQLFHNVIWGQKGNFLDVPTDCPQRDERLGWTGDAQIFAKTASYNFDVLKFYTKWLHDLAAEQNPDGGVPIVIPNLIPDAVPGAAWGDAATVCPWQMYLTYGDRSILEQQIESMRQWVDYMHSRGEEEYLWLGDTQFGDWLGMDAEDGSFKGASDSDFIASAYFAYSTEILVKALKVLGMDSAYYEELYTNIVNAFQQKYTACKTQTECALALVFRLAKDRRATAAKLAQLVHDNGNKLTTGFVGTPYLLEALSENGYPEIAYSLLLREECPSWLFSVNMGATTIWEHWDGMRADGTMWSTKMNSFNHYSFGAVAAWMYETIAGIRIDETMPGFENVLLCPQPDERLNWAEASVETRYGKVYSRWERNGDSIRHLFEVPNKATLTLNGSTETLSAGKYERIIKL